MVQMAGDFLNRANRKLSAILRLVACLVVTPASLVMFVVLMYVAHSVWSALLVAGLFCVVLSFALLLNHVLGPGPI